MSDISVIGLGKMGSAIASALLRSGRSVTVWNRATEKAAPLIEAGAVLASSPQEAVAASEAIMVCIKTHKTTTELLKPLSGELSGKTIIDLSTGGAEEANELVEVLTAAGAQWHIGMINAYPSGIGKKDTAILCAGPPEVWDRWEDAIRVLGGAAAHVGTEATAIWDAFERYCFVSPGDPPETKRNTPQPAENCDKLANRNAIFEFDVADRNPRKPTAEKGCGVVAGQTPPESSLGEKTYEPDAEDNQYDLEDAIDGRNGEDDLCEIPPQFERREQPQD